MTALSNYAILETSNAVLNYQKNSNDQIAFSTLYKKYYGEVYAFALHKVKEATAAEDITQECFLKVHKYVNSLKKQTSFKSWLFSIANNLCLNHFRLNKLKQNSVQSGDIELRLNLVENGKDYKEFLFGVLEKYMKLIKPADQELLIAKYIEQKSYDELSIELKLSHSALKMRIKRAKEQVYMLAKSEINNEFTY